MATVFPQGGAEQGEPAPALPDDPLERGRQMALEEMRDLRRPRSRQPKKQTLLQGRREYV